MAPPKRTATQRERDLEIVARRYLQGQTQNEIAHALEVSRQQVGYDLKILVQRWQESQLRDLDAAKARELVKIDHLERTYWQAWEESRAVKEMTVTELRDDGDTDDDPEGGRRHGKRRALVRKEKRDGEPRFLEGVLKCIERRCRILGIDAPKKIEATGKDGGPIEVENVSHQEQMELARLLTREERAFLERIQAKVIDVRSEQPSLPSGGCGGEPS